MSGKIDTFNEVSRPLATPLSLNDGDPMDSLYEMQGITNLNGAESRTDRDINETKRPAFVAMDSEMPLNGTPGRSPNEGISPNILEVDLKLIWSFRKVILLSLLISFSGFLFGYDTGVIGGIINMKTFIKRLGHLHYNETTGEEEYFLESYKTGLLVSSYHIGCITGGFTIGRLADTFGRKIPILISMVVYITGILIQITSQLSGKWYQFLVGRATSGLCIGSVAVLAPMFISETAPTVIRGSCTTLYQLNVCVAILTGSIVVYACKEMYTNEAEWIIPLSIGIGVAMAVCVGIFATPESARYLVSIGEYSKARDSLHKVEDPDVEGTLDILQEKLSLEHNAANVPFTEIFKKKYLKRLLVGVCLMTFQQMSGIDYFFYYGTTLFRFAGINDSYVTSIILALVNFVITIPGIYAIEKLGRKKSLLLGAFGSTISLFVYSIVGTLKIDKNPQDTSANKIPGTVMILFTCLFIFSFSPTWGASVSVLVSELYPIHIKSVSVAFATSFNWLSNFFIAFCTPIITEQIGYKYGFVFTGFMFTAFWFVLFMVPETQGVSLEEIEELFEKF